MVALWDTILQRINPTSKALQSVQVEMGVISTLFKSPIDPVSGIRGNFDTFDNEAYSPTEADSYRDDLKRTKTKKKIVLYSVAGGRKRMIA